MIIDTFFMLIELEGLEFPLGMQSRFMDDILLRNVSLRRTHMLADHFCFVRDVALDARKKMLLH